MSSELRKLIIVVIFWTFPKFSNEWVIKEWENVTVVEMKAKCSLLCPFQNEESANAIGDISCDMDCEIRHCVEGCHFLDDALTDDCEVLCNVPRNLIKTSDLYCLIGCEESTNLFFSYLEESYSKLEAPELLEDTLTSTSLSLLWLETRVGGDIYFLERRVADSSQDWEFCENQKWLSFVKISITGLKPFTKYQFRAVLRFKSRKNLFLYSKESAIVETLAEGPPSFPPEILSATAVDPTAISVIWKNGPFPNGRIISYILRINQMPSGFVAVRDVAGKEPIYSYLIQNLKAACNYSISLRARNSVGLGPFVNVVVRTHTQREFSNEKVELIAATQNSVYSIDPKANDDPVLLYNTTRIIGGIAVHIYKELLFICDSSGGILVASSKGIVTPREILATSEAKPLALTVDWLNDHLYVLGEILHSSGSIVYQIAKCGLDGSHPSVVVSGFIMKPHHIEVDPFNGYLIWVVHGVGLYRLDLYDINQAFNQDVTPDLILENAYLGAFIVDYERLRILITDQAKNTIISSSMDGQDVTNLRSNVTYEPNFHDVSSITVADGMIFCTDGVFIYQEIVQGYKGGKTYYYNVTRHMLPGNYAAILANTAASQPIPVPTSRPVDFKVIFGYDVAKASWRKPYPLAGQGKGAWSEWMYRIVVLNGTGVHIFDYDEVNTNQFTVTGLQPGEMYTLRVVAYSSAGEGPWTEGFVGKTTRTNVSIAWSDEEGSLLISDVTGYRVTQLEPANFIQPNGPFVIKSMDWYEDAIVLSTDERRAFWYNLTTNGYRQIRGAVADSLCVEWLAMKVYWSNSVNKMIFRADFDGSRREILPIVAAAEFLFVDSMTAFVYWSTRDRIERARFDGTMRKTYYSLTNFVNSQIVSLSLDLNSLRLYWMEKNSSTYVLSSTAILQNEQNVSRIERIKLSDKNVPGEICYADADLIWIRSGDKSAVISGQNGRIVESDNLSRLVSCTAIDRFSRISPQQLKVSPSSVQRSTIGVNGSYESFSISWSPVEGVNFGNVSYMVKVTDVDKETLLETNNCSINIGYEKAYVPLKVAIQARTLWSSSIPVWATLHSPSTLPSPPSNPRVFVIHKNNAFFSGRDKEISAVVRWSLPDRENGVLERYELSCSVNGKTNESSNVACSSGQISTKSQEFTLRNLPTDKNYYFKVRGCTKVGCGEWSPIVKTDLKLESPVPKLLIVRRNALLEMDFDKKTQDVCVDGGKDIKSATFDRDDVVYWIEENHLYHSNLHPHLANKKLITPLKNGKGDDLTYDWVSRILYWVEKNETHSVINSVDLNRVGLEEDRGISTVLERSRKIISLVASPAYSLLIWVETDDNSETGILMKCKTDGSNVKQFFNKEIITSSWKNDLSSSYHGGDEQEGHCNCSSMVLVGKAISLHPVRGDFNRYKIMWVDSDTGFITSSDLDGCFCHQITSTYQSGRHDLPRAITADFNRVYFLNKPGDKIYSGAGIFSLPVQQQAESVISFGRHLRRLPPVSCLKPVVKPDVAALVKFTSDSITLKLSPRFPHLCDCFNSSTASTEYTLYFGFVAQDGSSNCTPHNLRFCSQLVTYNAIKKVTKLKSYSQYVFMIAFGNYYSHIQNIEPLLGPPIIYKTAPGVPSPTRNVTVTVASPKSILVEWKEPEHMNAQSVWYAVFWRASNATQKGEKVLQSKPGQKLSLFLENLASRQKYFITVRCYAFAGMGFSDSENVTCETFPEPSDLKIINATGKYAKISLPNNTGDARFQVELYDSSSKLWKMLPRFGDEFVEVRNLQPLASYMLRLKMWYAYALKTPYLWPPDGFSFQTTGDIPEKPGHILMTRLKDGRLKISWQSSRNHGSGLVRLSYKLESLEVDEEMMSSLNKSESDDWFLAYNGTDNFWMADGLKLGSKYIFRVSASNEYGWSEFGDLSQVLPVDKDDSWPLTRWGILFWLFLLACGLFLAVFAAIILSYVCRKRRNRNKNRSKMALLEYLGDFELTNLKGMDARAPLNVANILYEDKCGDTLPPTNEEISKIHRVPRDHITLTKFLGCGAFGEVYEGYVKNLLYENCDTKVAIKALRKNATEMEKIEFLKEALLMNNFKHKHILQMLGLCLDNDPNFIIMELMESGDLLSYLRSSRSALSQEDNGLVLLDLLDICCDVASGCCYLEEMHFVHRDLACRNCLVSLKTGARVVKIGDFGLARNIYKSDYYRKEGEGLLPVRWMAPESLMDGVFTSQSDVWSFGVLTWEVATVGQQPYQARSNVEVLQYVRSGGRLCRPDNCPRALYELMKNCWNFNPEDRPTFAYCLSNLEALKTNFINDYHKEDTPYMSFRSNDCFEE